MDYSLVQALKYASTDLGFGRLLERAVSRQVALNREDPEFSTDSQHLPEGHFYWLQEIRKVDPTASGDSVGHLHAVAKVLAGVADHSTLPASLHSDNSPLGQFLKSRLKPKEPVPTGQSPLEPLSLSVEPDPLPKVVDWKEGMVPPETTPSPSLSNALKTLQSRKAGLGKVPAPPSANQIAALRKSPLNKD